MQQPLTKLPRYFNVYGISKLPVCLVIALDKPVVGIKGLEFRRLFSRNSPEVPHALIPNNRRVTHGNQGGKKIRTLNSNA